MIGRKRKERKKRFLFSSWLLCKWQGQRDVLLAWYFLRLTTFFPLTSATHIKLRNKLDSDRTEFFHSKVSEQDIQFLWMILTPSIKVVANKNIDITTEVSISYHYFLRHRQIHRLSIINKNCWRKIPAFYFLWQKKVLSSCGSSFILTPLDFHAAPETCLLWNLLSFYFWYLTSLVRNLTPWPTL